MIKKKIDKKMNKTERIINLKERAKRHAKEFNKEFKKATNTAIMAAFGFLIALVWKDVITEFVDTISSRSPVQGKLFSAIIVTLICVAGILILTRLLSEKENKEDENKK
jgi:Na+/proline symporter